jgi:uncharacterized low-complexity protein
MAAILPWVIGGATLFSAMGSVQAGQAQNEAARYAAQQAEQAAGQSRAASQRAAEEERRQARIVASRARAAAGSSGAGVTDPTVTNIIGDIEGEGEYRALTALYQGEDRARTLETDAALRRFEGRQARKSGMFDAAGTIFAGGSKLLERYG